jgi:hypothetical protein
MSIVDEGLAKKLGYQGSMDRLVELLKNTLPIPLNILMFKLLTHVLLHHL